MFISFKIVFLLLLTESFSLTSNYYARCADGAPKEGFITVSDCKNYATNGSYCCLLYYVTNPDVEYHYHFDDLISVDKNNKTRKLSERINICYGLTPAGFNNIWDVIDELEEDSEIDDIHINCFAKKIIFDNYIIFLSLLLLF